MSTATAEQEKDQQVPHQSQSPPPSEAGDFGDDQSTAGGDDNQSTAGGDGKRSASRRRNRGRGRRSSRANSGALGPVSNIANGLTETAGNLGNSALQGGEENGGKKPLRLRLDLNLDVEIEIKARIHGDITLALLS
ncbi:hypothetical protein HK104_002465 [Borealophlyctis nickersoniae]|nr:hypothetical protein HK104_002465 [Borealophlyctis nickersoniae]